MGERTSPVEALKRITWHLNFRTGETLSLNELSEITGLAWETVQKYVKVIETIQKISPQLSYDSEGVKVGHQTQTMRRLLSDPSLSLALYLYIHARQTENPTGTLQISEHEDTLQRVPETLEMMESLGWIDRTEDTIRLTPLGVQIAGPTYAGIRKNDQQEDVLKVDRERRLAVIESAEASETTPSVKSQDAGASWGIADSTDYRQSYQKTPQYSEI